MQPVTQMKSSIHEDRGRLVEVVGWEKLPTEERNLLLIADFG